MTRPRRLLAVVLIATALSADRLAIAAPSVRPQVGPVARLITSRLAVSFRHIVPAAKLRLDRADIPAAQTIPAAIEDQAAPHPTQQPAGSFRLPPPQA